MAEPARQRFTFDDYVRLEADSPIKHEYLGGHVWAMAGGTPEHSALCMSVGHLLMSQLHGQPCRVFTSDLRVRVKKTGLGTYPDISVVCGKLELDPEDPKGHTVLNPRLLVEVLSDSTETYDGGEKLEHYQQIASLDEIVLVAQNERRIDVFRREGNSWHQTVQREGAAQLGAFGCELVLEEVYRNPLAESR